MIFYIFVWQGRKGPEGYPGITGEKGDLGETVFGPPGINRLIKISEQDEENLEEKKYPFDVGEVLGL